MNPVICPNCASSDTNTTDTRPKKDIVYRRRRCKACGQRWTTHENIMKIDGKPNSDLIKAVIKKIKSAKKSC